MAVTGKGKHPFRSVWLERSSNVNSTVLRKVISPGHGTDTAVNTVWADWYFVAAAVGAVAAGSTLLLMGVG